MNSWKTIDCNTFDFSPFQMIGKEWLLIAAQKEDKVNAMTASWGGFGVLWGKNVAYIFVRKSRYTKELIDGSDTFSLSVLDHKAYADVYAYMGKVSGRDEDKIKKTGLSVSVRENIPYFEEANTVFLCKTLCCQPIDVDCFLDETLAEKFYSDHDYHDMYVGEILAVLEK